MSHAKSGNLCGSKSKIHLERLEEGVTVMRVVEVGVMEVEVEVVEVEVVISVMMVAVVGEELECMAD